jgi:hypothetical protein
MEEVAADCAKILLFMLLNGAYPSDAEGGTVIIRYHARCDDEMREAEEGV